MIECRMFKVIGSLWSTDGDDFDTPCRIFFTTKLLAGSGQPWSLCLYAIAEIVVAMVADECVGTKCAMNSEIVDEEAGKAGVNPTEFANDVNDAQALSYDCCVDGARAARSRDEALSTSGANRPLAEWEPCRAMEQ